MILHIKTKMYKRAISCSLSNKPQRPQRMSLKKKTTIDNLQGPTTKSTTQIHEAKLEEGVLLASEITTAGRLAVERGWTLLFYVAECYKDL